MCIIVCYSMNFQNLPKIEDFQFYLDVAFSRASKKASETRSSSEGLRIKKSINIEIRRIDVIRSELTSIFENIYKKFPSFEDMHPFYQELVALYLDKNQLKKSLGAMKWVSDKINELHNKYEREIKYIRLFKDVNPKRNQFMGRVSSIVKQIKSDLIYLEEARKRLLWFPSIKTKTYTVSISGFPNVGKSTLLSKITSAKPEINSYAFTTRRLNIGYFDFKNQTIQCIDTPGTLNRFNKMNDIEKLAYLAIKYVAQIIVYVFDLTEEYPISDQIKLLETLQKDFGKDFLIYFSKSDILGSEVIENFKEKYSKELKKNKEISKAIKEGVYDFEELKKMISKSSVEFME